MRAEDFCSRRIRLSIASRWCLTSEVRSGDSQHIFAKDFSDRLVAVPALHHADGEERPVGPGEALLGVRLGLEIVRWPEVLPARSRRVRPFRHPGALGFVVARDVGNIWPDGHMVGAKLFHRVVQVVEERAEIARAAEKTRDAADANEPACVADGFHRIVWLATEMFVQPGARRVA